MARHSKHNTASGHFTYAEYQMLKDRWGSRRLRLTVESMRAFYACCLCLQKAQRPVCCAEGHVFCKVGEVLMMQECILSDLVTQKTQLAEHAKRKAELLQKKAEQEREQLAIAEQERISAFESTENGIGNTTLKRKSSESHHPDPSRSSKPRMDHQPHPENPAFWLPTMAPEQEVDALQETAQDHRPSTTLCIAGSDQPHKLTMKSLRPVHFHTREMNDKQQFFCPSCKKELPHVAQVSVLRTCGHVLCMACTKQLVSLPLQREEANVACPECSEAVSKSQQIVAIAREGTGFASGGRAEAQAKGIMFQG
ncbi:hypothetical protein MYAM1_002836 [Malassezia yamatoensis]|uniref:RING-type domain-containing protein n=1 Tax=Malassezia yamatoensis TaxID=253288 RepID=A0AAJ5Z0Q4_9BASI|nr:hypothetical protein MYAM1_002836 [Malassezia yamatoensis]